MKETAKKLLSLIQQGNAYKTFPAQKEGNVIILGHIQYDFCFYDIVKKIGPDYEYRQHIEAVKQKPIAELTLSEISTYFTWIDRGERFCDGHIANFIDNGTVTKLLERLIELC